MTLTILSDDKYTYDEEFIQWLCDTVATEILCKLNSLKLDVFNSLIADKKLFPDLTVDIDIRKAIIYGVRNFKCRSIQRGWSIYIDPVINYPKTSIKVVTLCKLVDAGGLGPRGINLFTEEYKLVTTNLTKYYEMYMSEV